MKKYEDIARLECFKWQRKMMKRSSIFGRAAKGVQNKINKRIPQKVHDIVTASIKRMVQGVLAGSKWTTRQPAVGDFSLHDREDLVRKKIKNYKRVAAIEGAGTGAGGFWMAMADFPALLSIKMKFLFDTAAIYGFDVKDYRERLYLLHVFQVAFSSDAKRRQSFQKLKNWSETIKNYPPEDIHANELDWQSFQQEYRDYIDLIKLLQMIPGLGAVVGAIANYRFLDELGETAMNAYRMRLLED